MNRLKGGFGHALGAYLLWGLLPLYLRFVRDVPPFEFVGWRILFTVPICLIAIAVMRQWPALRAVLSSPRTLGVMLISALLIGNNWLIYVLAIQHGHVYAASLGYYINPLVNILAATVLLGEKLSPLRWAAVALACIGVGTLAFGAFDTLGISLALAISFCGYGLVRKLAPVDALPGLTVEALLLALPAIGLVAWQAQVHGGISLGHSLSKDALIAFAGVITAIPLLMFTYAAKRMDYSTIGFMQFIAPTMVFLTGVFVFHEPLKPVQLVSFAFIWSAAALFSWDLIRHHTGSAPQAPAD